MAAVAVPPLVIRPVLCSDLDAVSGLEKVCFKDPYPPYLISQLAEAKGETFLVAIIDEALVGYAVLCRWRGHAHLISIAVHPDNRRRGIGRRLLAALEEKLEEVRLFRLEARKSNLSAIEFYRGFGFSETGVIAGYYSDGEDAVVMERNLIKGHGPSIQTSMQSDNHRDRIESHPRFTRSRFLGFLLNDALRSFLFEQVCTRFLGSLRS